MDAIHPPEPPPAGPPVNRASEDRMTGGAPLTQVHRDYVKVVRIKLSLLLVPVMIVALVIETAGLPLPGMLAVPVVLLAGIVLVAMPWRRYGARGYDMGADRLRIARGILFRTDTVVPFGRVQHLDVTQGPIERRYGLATLTLYTAGTHNDSVSLPGLPHAQAVAMREAIRAHVRRETM